MDVCQRYLLSSAEDAISRKLPPRPNRTDPVSLSPELSGLIPPAAPPLLRDGGREAPGVSGHPSHFQRELLAALHELAVTEEQVRAQTQALAAAERRLEAERLAWQRQTEESMEALNRVLNARVAQRTRELELALEGEQAARREAEAANRIKSELFARLSHEFRTPLHAVSGYLEILQQNIHGALTMDQRRDIERIHQAQEHLLALVNMILDFAKIEGGQVELAMAEIPVEETIGSAEALVAPQFAKKGISYSHKDGDPSITVFADREKVQQILVNLLANAMRFTAPGGAVSLEWEVENEILLVRIRDTGPGIPDDMIEQIFEPFVQLRSPGSPPAGGTGLGLPISRDLARAMGGDVQASSTVGTGSVFTMSLPVRLRPTGIKLSAS